MRRIPALVAFSVLAGFLAILIFEVREPDLIAIVCLTVALVAWDFFTSSGSDKER